MEIGGYLNLESNQNNLYHKNAIKLNSGRNCLRVLIRHRKIKKIYLPYYICDAVIEACNLENCDICYYPLNPGFRIKNEIIDFNKDTDFLYLVNYCGLLTNEDIKNYYKKYQNIILDNTQDFFRYNLFNIDTIYSCRKFFGVPDGAYLYTNINIQENYEYDYSYDRMLHILGRYELGAEKFYQSFKENEAKISLLPIKYMSKLTDNIMRIIDYKYCMKTRSNNYIFLYNELNSLNQLELPANIEGAFSYPLLTDNAQNVKEYLVKEKIFIPQYWKEVLDRTSEGTVEYQYTQNILWLPCDQRYTEKEMSYMVEKIKLIAGG